MVISYKGRTPKLGRGVWIAPTAVVIGDVQLGDDVSIWFGAVVRGDVFHIRIGAGTNIQDNSVVHVTSGQHATIIGRHVTVGHGVTLHGCEVQDRALIGIGAIVLDQAVIGEEAMVAAGSVVTPRTVIPPRMMAVGSPARPKRPLTDSELEHVRSAGSHYVALAKQYGPT
jgi:carbonic anhydrase/acetyltransferase-like protein (isoleucine patch superfamily)